MWSTSWSSHPGFFCWFRWKLCNSTLFITCHLGILFRLMISVLVSLCFQAQFPGRWVAHKRSHRHTLDSDLTATSLTFSDLRREVGNSYTSAFVLEPLQAAIVFCKLCVCVWVVVVVGHASKKHRDIVLLFQLFHNFVNNICYMRPAWSQLTYLTYSDITHTEQSFTA